VLCCLVAYGLCNVSWCSVRVVYSEVEVSSSVVRCRRRLVLCCGVSVR